MLLDEYVRRTGYPEEMLGIDLDLEAELGIDTVKQVAILGAVRERLGLPPDPRFKLREASTIAKAAEVLARRLAGEQRPPAAASTAAPADRLGPGSGPGSFTAGEPRERNPRPAGGALPAPAPGTPTPLGTAARLLEAILAAAGDDVAELATLTIGGESAGSGDRQARVGSTTSADGAVRLQATVGDAMAVATVRTGRPDAAPVPAPPELLAATAPARRERAARGDELRAALEPVLGDTRGFLDWARSDGFMATAGGVRLPDGPAAARLGAMLAAAAELASFAWMGLTGAPHALTAMERVRLLGLPEAGAEVGLYVKMITPESGLWRADVRAVSGGVLVAEIHGLTGMPVRPAPKGQTPADSAADRAWRRFCRRMRAEHASEDVA